MVDARTLVACGYGVYTACSWARKSTVEIVLFIIWDARNAHSRTKWSWLWMLVLRSCLVWDKSLTVSIAHG